MITTAASVNIVADSGEGLQYSKPAKVHGRQILESVLLGGLSDS
jgi:hypothetical protein